VKDNLKNLSKYSTQGEARRIHTFNVRGKRNEKGRIEEKITRLPGERNLTRMSTTSIAQVWHSIGHAPTREEEVRKVGSQTGEGCNSVS